MTDLAVTGDCLNCGASLQGRYCASCGQKAATGRLSLRNLLAEAIDEFLNLDGKIVRTLKVLVLRPGQLTAEFLSGRRVSYVSPLRTYLIMSILFFSATAFVPGGTGFITVTSSDQVSQGWSLSTTAAQRSPGTREAAPELRQRVVGSFMNDLSRAMFVLMPAAALLTFAFFRRHEPYFVSHLYHAIHLHAFAFLALTICVLFNRLGPGLASQLAGAAAALAIVPYHFAGLRRVFREPWGSTIWKGTTIALLYLILLGVAMGIAMMLALSNVGRT
jgi:hypothetical protein